MKVAVVGSRGLYIDDISFYIPSSVTEIVSGGARGVDTKARIFAEENSLKYTGFLPDYDKYGRVAPIKRNDLIVDRADMVVALWDGRSRGTKYVIDRCMKIKKSLVVFHITFYEEVSFAEISRCEYCNLTPSAHKAMETIGAYQLITDG